MVTETLPKGYKQTEVGVIPEDWEVKKLGDIADVKTGPFGSSLHERDYVNDGTPIITVEHLGEMGVVHENLPMVSDFDRKRLNAYSLQTDDIVFSRVGSVDRNSIIKVNENGWLFSGRLLRIRLDPNYVVPKYLSYYFHQESAKQRIRTVAVGQTMASLNTKILKNVKVAFPKIKTEQSAIARVLSDTDTLIESLDKLIAKKKNVKQGAMQQLLTGKKRLPGFKGEWEVKRLGDVAEITKGQGLSKGKLSPSGNYPCILYGELFTTYKEEIKEVYSKSNFNEGKLSKYGDILIPGSTTTVGIDLAKASALLINDVLLGGDINILRNFNNIYDSSFLAYCLTHIYKNQIAQKAKGITIYHLQGKDLKDLVINMPEAKEQSAIAQILSDMDAEIKYLEQKRDKYVLIKQGMMQQLLTGRIRIYAVN